VASGKELQVGTNCDTASEPHPHRGNEADAVIRRPFRRLTSAATEPGLLRLFVAKNPSATSRRRV
jgi:hypothetical protein